ncbi:hypothetical protein ACJX0J_031439 [Zea mays]
MIFLFSITTQVRKLEVLLLHTTQKRMKDLYMKRENTASHEIQHYLLFRECIGLVSSFIFYLFFLFYNMFLVFVIYMISYSITCFLFLFCLEHYFCDSRILFLALLVYHISCV